MPPKSLQQRSIASFFSPGKRPENTPRSSTKPSSSPEYNTKKHLLQNGHLPNPSQNPSNDETPAQKRPRVDSSLVPETPSDDKPSGIQSHESFVGKRLKVYWPMDEAYYEGCVHSYDEDSGMHSVLYDDGEFESLILANEKVQWIDAEESVKKTKFRRLKKLSEFQRESNFEEDKCLPTPQPETPSLEVSKRAEGSDSLDAGVKEAEVSSDDDDSDEDWGGAGNGKGVVEKSESEEEELEEEEEVLVGKKRKRTQSSRALSCKPKAARKVNYDTPKRTMEVSLAKKVKLDVVKDQEMKTVDDKNVGGRRPCFSPTPVASVQRKSDDSTQVPDKSSCKKANAMQGGDMPNLSGEAAERFGNRLSEKLMPVFRDRKDAAGKRPGDPAHNPKTLYLPQEFLKSLSGGQRQWWEFKSQHMDKVLFFKMGKFYELFEMDAHVGAQELDLQYMKGEQPHCGFPEKNFQDNVEKLARKGYRVLVVEQTETPDQLEQRRKETGSKDKVVKREICAVVTKGTMVEGGMLDMCPDASHMISIAEKGPDSFNSTQSVSIGICIADASTSRFILGQFSDDSARSCLRSILSETRPAEIIKPKGMLSKETEKLLRDETRNPLINDLIPEKEFWNAEVSLKEIRKLYLSFISNEKQENTKCRDNNDGFSDTNNRDLPDAVCLFANAGENGELALSAFGGCLSYLRQIMLDHSLLKFGKLEILPCSDISVDSSLVNGICVNLTRDYMILDAAALENLEILENSHDFGSSGTLYAQLDHCVTGFGKRLLKRWLVRPLKHVKAIVERQDAIAELNEEDVNQAAIAFQRQLAKLPDMERLLARLYSYSGASGRNGNKVVLYEDAAKKQLKEFVSALRGCQCLLEACLLFRESIGEIKSHLLQQNLTPGKQLPDVRNTIKEFEKSFDWSEAERTGRIFPLEGTNKEYEITDKRVKEIETALKNYLEAQRKHFRNHKEINYVTVGKDCYQLEIPESILSKVPEDFEAHSSRKGFRRFSTPKIKQLVQELNDAQAEKEACLKGILQELIKQFCQFHNDWRDLVMVVGELDVLISLAFSRNYFDGPVCRPSIRKSMGPPGKNDHSAHLCAKMLGHPILSGSFGSRCFVPNNVNLGGNDASFLLITGPNMGGKSTLIRQVCLAVILAQLGADVPAEEFKLSPVDRIFVRMGAKDHIMTGQSTFLVELQETASMLSSATNDSLIALDELGRGTATSDGQAIAHAVLDHLAHKIGCRGMFSTHYHHLAIEYEEDPVVGLCHMGCKVGTLSGGLEEVTFLYKLKQGACPRSYGVNVARLAGMPDIILERAAKKSAEFEEIYGSRSNNHNSDQSLSRSCEEGCLIQDVLRIIEQFSSLTTTQECSLKLLLDHWHKAHKMLA